MRLFASFALCVLTPLCLNAMPWVVPDWQGREPKFEPGSLFWRTREFTISPTLYRTVLTLPAKPLDFAAVRIQTRRYAYLFATRFDRFSELDPFGKLIAKAEAAKERPDAEVELLADLTTYLVDDSPERLPRREIALLLSAPSDGFRMEGVLVFRDGSAQIFGSEPNRWRVQKFPPLTVLEFEPCMKPDFDDRNWFPVRVAVGAIAKPTSQLVSELRKFVAQERQRRLNQQLEDARWRLTLLRDKGIVIVDDEAFGWAGAERFPEWVRKIADKLLLELGGHDPQRAELIFGSAEADPSELHPLMVEVLSLFVWASDEVTNLANHVKLWQALRQPERAQKCKQELSTIAPLLQKAERLLRGHETNKREDESPDESNFKARQEPRPPRNAHDVYHLLRELRKRLLALRHHDVAKALVINDLNSGLENKFGWFDTTVLLDNDISRWGLRVSTPATIFASPLSPAALVTVKGTEFTLEGWENLKPLRVYQKPPDPTPVCLWVVINGKVQNLRPQPEGTVYDRTQHGHMSENWMLLVCDMARGGGLPIQFVFLQAPKKVVFRRSEKGTTAVSIVFQKPNAQLFVLKPLKEWRGFLRTAQVLTRAPLNENEAAPFINQCRLWSQALLYYPVTFSEAFVRDPSDPETLIVANAYNYLELRDEWNTKPLKLASLPPLASYGLLKGYPKLQVLSDAKVLGSWGVWGEHIAVVNGDVIVYRVPIHPFKRFGGFTAFCFGPTDIGVPGNLTELDLIKRTGSNSFRPQHNRTDEAAMQLVRWCVERGLQHVFNVDEKWLSDVVEHYRTLAKLCKDLPPDAVAYDLLNEPETRDPRAYNALLRRVTQAIREHDKTHLIYAEVIAPWGPNAQPYPEAAFENLEPTDDPLTVYSFHDYEYRLMPRYPNEKVDIRTLLERWLPAFKFSIDHRSPIHLGEFGAFEQTKEDIYSNRCAITMLLDHFRIFDRFGWHFHYYSNRGIVRVRKDGSVEESLVQEAYRRYFGRGRLNAVRQ